MPKTTCPYCGKKLPPYRGYGRPKKYCDRSHKNAAERQKRKAWETAGRALLDRATP